MVLGVTSYAQNNYTKSDDAARIVISSYVPEQVEGLSDISIQNLSNKLDQITTNAGIGGSYSRFIITPSVNILGKEITSLETKEQSSVSIDIISLSLVLWPLIDGL